MVYIYRYKKCVYSIVFFDGFKPTNDEISDDDDHKMHQLVASPVYHLKSNHCLFGLGNKTLLLIYFEYLNNSKCYTTNNLLVYEVSIKLLNLI